MTEKRTCSKRVFSGARWDMRGHKCGKPAKFEENGTWLCTIHCAAGEKKRQQKADERYAIYTQGWAEKSKREKEIQRRYDLHDELLSLLVESQTSIAGDWRERRDAVIEKAQSK